MAEEPFVFRVSHGVGLLTVPFMEPFGFYCAMSTRLGGVTEGEASTMNLSFKRKDTPEHVRENYRRLARAVERPLSSLCLSRQVHGTQVLEATVEDAERSLAPGAVSRAGDAWISDDPALTLVRHHADCTPIFLADPEHGAMALIHAGWRGAVDGITGKTLAAMACRYGTRPEAVQAVIGPCIDVCCFEIQEDVAVFLRERFPEAPLVRIREGRMYGDLKGCSRLQLLRGGVPEAQIHVTGLCTACEHELLSSHRREGGHTGIMASVMAML